MENINETWKEIPELIGCKASSLGRIKVPEKRYHIFGNLYKIIQEKITYGIFDKTGGYMGINIECKKYSVHRLIASAFHANPENKPTINHKNSNRRDNRPDNLEWATWQENNLHAFAYGNNPKGQDKSNTHLTNVHVKTIRDLWATGKYQQRQLAKLFSIHQHTIWSIVNRQTWKHI